MDLSFVVFRYQRNLMKDDWVPLGVVAECQADDATEIGVLCFASAEIPGSSEMTAAMLQDVPAILTKEVEETRAKVRPGEDFLELLRARNPWNFHFTAPQTKTVGAENLQQATMELFYCYVLRQDAPRNTEPRREPRKTIRPRRMEAYEVAVYQTEPLAGYW